MFSTAAEIERELIAAGIDVEPARRLAAAARPAVWLETREVADDREIAIGATKIGGGPDLPPGVAWPARPAYPDAAKRTRNERQSLTAPDSHWRWATPEECAAMRKDAAERIALVENELPLPLLMQIDFAEMWAAGPLDPDLPHTGRLAVFYDLVEQPWGFDPGDRLASQFLFHDVPASELTRLAPPAALDRLPEHNRLAPLACRPSPCMTPLPAATAHYRQLGLPAEVLDLLHDWWSSGSHLYSTEGGLDWKCHHVGGWPTPVQGDMQTECALVTAGHSCGNSTSYKAPELASVRATATDWLMLAQIGSDDKGNACWGDSGQIYVWIRRDDLKARRFERAHLVMQCY